SKIPFQNAYRGSILSKNFRLYASRWFSFPRGERPKGPATPFPKPTGDGERPTAPPGPFLFPPGPPGRQPAPPIRRRKARSRPTSRKGWRRAPEKAAAPTPARGTPGGRPTTPPAAPCLPGVPQPGRTRLGRGAPTPPLGPRPSGPASAPTVGELHRISIPGERRATTLG